MSELTHFDAEGKPRMVDVGQKPVTARLARARARVRMQPETLAKIQQGEVAKGDVLGVARLAGIMASKRTHELIPLCHPLRLDSVEVDLTALEPDQVEVIATARAHDRTGVEMEALVAASAAALTVYDMCKA
ncbi:MAG TPA: cyclic pyranopterin monophosphate synthase MoaC, partial [Planctomycetes bacterium]|nr:cyclic pyranopterin monophosphate synthase MoaC [Planctomycetota bacterium]